MFMSRVARVVLLVVGIAVWTGGAASADEIIVYTALRPANWDIFLVTRGEQPPRQLTTHAALDYNAVLSPDGRWVVFCSERRGNPDLYAIDLHNSGSPKLLTSSVAMDDAPAFSPDGKTLAFVSTRGGEAAIYSMAFDVDSPHGDANATQLTESHSGGFNPAFSPDGAWIAFASDRDGYRASEIYVMRTDGSAAQRLTDSPGWDGSPCWSLDGTAIYFYSDRGNGDTTRIYRMGHDGSGITPVSTGEGGALSPTISPAGRIVYGVEMSSGAKIVSTDAAGGSRRDETDSKRSYWAPAYDGSGERMVCHGEVQLPGEEPFASSTPGPFLVDNQERVRLLDRSLTIWAIRGYFPSLSPDGQYVASDEGFYSVVISRLDGTSRRDAFKPSSGRVWRPSWSTDGKWLTLAVGPTFAQPQQSVNIWKFGVENLASINLTADVDTNDAFPDFSPDGRRIVFRSGESGNHEIYVMNSDGSHRRRLTHHDAVDTMPAFSSKGDKIAFTSARDDGDYEIYLMDIDAASNGSPPRRVTHSKGRDTHPKFSPDDRWLVFASERGGMNDEAPLIPVFNPQPYGEIFAVRLSDGLNVRLTHNKWEDGTPTWGIRKESR